jgi:hypothetical protein
MLFEHTLFFNDPSLLFQEYKKRNLFGTLEYLFLVDERLVCVTPDVEVCMYMWVYTIMGA